jgi:hypothetical protein
MTTGRAVGRHLSGLSGDGGGIPRSYRPILLIQKVLVRLSDARSDICLGGT